MHASNGILFNHESPVRGETFEIGFDQSAGDVEGGACVEFLEHRRATRRGADRRIVEGEGDHRTAVVELRRRDAQMPRQLVADARFQI